MENRIYEKEWNAIENKMAMAQNKRIILNMEIQVTEEKH